MRNKRSYLKDIVPLDMPLSVQIEPTGNCNFRCVYCYHSLEKEKQRPAINLSMDLYRKFIQDSKSFPRKYKSLTFCGGGEPLLNKDIFEMIKLANGVADETVILTNGSLLSSQIIDKLVESKLSILRVSLQGINALDYQVTCGVKINFDRFLSNLEYLYKNKKDMKVVFKMPDIAIETEEKKKKFYELFEDKCDSLTIQVISNLVNDLDYENIQKNANCSLYGEGLQKIKACPQAFYTMIFDQQGNVFPCSDAYYNLTSPKVGSIVENTIKEIWDSPKLKNLRITHLKGERFLLDSCKSCSHILALNNEYDNLDNNLAETLEKFKD